MSTASIRPLRHIGARDQQHDTHEAHQQIERQPDLVTHLEQPRAARSQPDAARQRPLSARFIRQRGQQALVREALERAVHLGLRLPRRDTWLDARDHANPVIAAARQRIRHLRERTREGHRHEHVRKRSDTRPTERGGRNPNHREQLPIQPDRLARDRRIAVEPLHPDLIADDSDLPTPAATLRRPVIVFTDRRPDRHFDAKH
jgi:hypothetical protein